MGIGTIIMVVIGLIALGYYTMEFLKKHNPMDVVAGVFITISFIVLIFFIFYLKNNNHQIGGH